MEFPCGICGDHVLETHEAVQCDGQCCLWHHRECLGMTLDEYLKLSKGKEDWFCGKCTVKQEIKQEAEAERRRQLRQRSKMRKTKIECKKLDDLTGNQKCVFCHQTYIDEIKYGPVYMHKNIITHYYCLLLSSNMEQNGRDSDGILGFLANDMHKEVRRGVRLYCTYCKRGGATLGCAVAKCKVVFHLPCGLKHGTLHQFFGEFKSYCAKHKPVQKISAKILSEANKNAMCGICYEKVVPRPIQETLWAPCCQKSAFFHRDCVQRLALSAGYFFKCPLCNNTSTFQQEMKEYGIYIPEQDASWECVPNAYQDLLVRHDTCDSATCSCPRGRKTNDQGTRWELILCKFCGSQGIHIGCGRLKWKSPEFVCDTCSGNERQEETNTRNYEGNRHRLSGSGRTPAILPSASAVREEDTSSDNSSDESLERTITNRRGRLKIISPPRIETPSPPTKTYKTDNHLQSSSPTRTIKGEDVTYVIDDSDDEDVEVVGETKGESCLKTIQGATIPIVKVHDNVKKRLDVYGDIKVAPDEIVDITTQSEGPPLKKPPSPLVEEIIYEFPSSHTKPSTSTSSSTSFCPPPLSVPAPPLDVTKFVLVDPATFRPEDYPPGSLVYRSFTPMVQMPQTSAPVQPQVQPVVTTQVPMPQLGGANGGSADAKHSDLSKHRAWGHVRLHAPEDYSAKTSRTNKHNCSGRRGGGRSDNDRRLNSRARVLVSPLKCRISDGGFFEIIVPRRNLGFGFSSGSLKRKSSPLPSKPAKKSKSKGTERKKKTSKKKSTRKKETRKSSKKKKAEVSQTCVTTQTSSPVDSNMSSTSNISGTQEKIETTLSILNHKKENKSTISSKKPAKNKKLVLKWNWKKIDNFFKSPCDSKPNQAHLNWCEESKKQSHEEGESSSNVKIVMDEIIRVVIDKHFFDVVPALSSNKSDEKPSNILSEVCNSTNSSIHSEIGDYQDTSSNKHCETSTAYFVMENNSSTNVSDESHKDMNHNRNETDIEDENLDATPNRKEESSNKIFGLFPKLKLNNKRKMNGNAKVGLSLKAKKRKIEKHSPVNNISSIRRYFSPVKRDVPSLVEASGNMLPKCSNIQERSNEYRPAGLILQENMTFLNRLNIQNSPERNKISLTHSDVKLENGELFWRSNHSSPEKRPLSEINLNETANTNVVKAITFRDL